MSARTFAGPHQRRRGSRHHRRCAALSIAGALAAVSGMAPAGAGSAAVAPYHGGTAHSTGTGYWTPNSARTFPRLVEYPDATGTIAVLNADGPTATRGNPFFTALGTNGRACVTCHQPDDGMSVSVATIRARWRATGGRDPLFAAIDGSNCPSLPQNLRKSHSLLLHHGLFRIARPWPPRDPDGRVITPQFTIQVVRDPTGCNLDPKYGLYSRHPMISVFRRPRPAANLKYVTAVGFTFDPKDGLPLPIDPETGLRMSGNILADARAGTLKAQVLDAMRTHLQVRGNPNPADVAKVIAFESSLYTAQIADRVGGSLTADGATGGPEALATGKPGELNSPQHPQWSEFFAWARKNRARPSATPAERAFRASVLRGIELFTKKTFLVRDSAGLNSMNFGNPVRNTCNFCHNMNRTGMDVAPGQVDIGTTNEPRADPQPGLPLFKLTCAPQFPPQPFLGRVVYTHDPGYALTTGKCADIGKITIQSLRGLAARPPYFSNGSAPTIRAVVDFYNRRYRIGLTEREKRDLTNFLSVL